MIQLPAQSTRKYEKFQNLAIGHAFKDFNGGVFIKIKCGGQVDNGWNLSTCKPGNFGSSDSITPVVIRVATIEEVVL